MLRGAIRSASAIVGTAVFRIVESSDSMKNATATSHGSSNFADSIGGGRSCVTNRGEELGAPNAIRLGALVSAAFILRGAIRSASAIGGTAVFRIVESSDSTILN